MVKNLDKSEEPDEVNLCETLIISFHKIGGVI